MNASTNPPTKVWLDFARTGVAVMSGAFDRRLALGTIGNLLAVVLNQGSTFAVSITIARLLGRHAFGEYVLIQTSLVSLAGIFQLALGFSATKYVAEYRTSNRAKAGRIIGLCKLGTCAAAAVAALCLFLGASWFGSHFLNHEALAPALRAGSVYVFLSVVNGYQTGILAGLEEYGLLAHAGAVSGVSAVLLIGAGAQVGGSVGALLGLVASALARWIFHAVVLGTALRRHDLRATYADAAQECRILLRFTLPAALAGYYSVPLLWLANTLLAKQPSGYGEFAIYSASTNLRLAALFLPSVVNTVGLSVLNNIKGKGVIEEYRTAFQRNSFAISWAAALGALMVGLAGSSLLSLFGKEFSGDPWVLPILLVSVLPEALTMASCQYLQSSEHLWLTFFVLNVPREGGLLVLAYLLAPRYGATGLSAAYAVAQGLGCCTARVTVRRLEARKAQSGAALLLQRA